MKHLFLVMVFGVAVFEIHAKSYVKRDDQGGTILDHIGGLKESILNDKSIPSAEEIEYINEVEDVDSELEEGDIVPEESSDDNGEQEKRNALRNRKSLWRTKIVPYEVTDELIEGGYMDTIKAAIAEFHNCTCIRWKPHEDEPYWVLFFKASGCWSYLGFISRKPQQISLGDGCNSKGIAMHEMMHALGFRHEQSRPDRDKYVEIFWENIKPGKQGNFAKGALKSTDPLEASYDFKSLMHYGKGSFSVSGKDTIEVIGDPDQRIGYRDGLSTTDIEQLNALYDCSNPEHGWSAWSNFGPCDDECFHTRQRFCSHEDLSNCPGADTRGVQTEKVKCPPEKCNASLDGHWGRWSSWGDCSVSCDTGTHTRMRQCNDPAPKNGGKNCVGNSEDVKKCLLTVCNLGPYDTAFESEGMHGWELCDSPRDGTRPEWKITMFPTGTSGTGPDQDHTTGSGGYIYFESSYGKQGDTDCFYSPEIAPNTCKRFTFWYHMYGSKMGKLRVLVKSSDGSTKTVWERSCQQGFDWLPASVDISSETPFQIYFEGVRGPWTRGDVGVDDVKFTDCSASPSAPPARVQGSPNVCFSNPLGVSDPAIIPDSHMTASSEYRTCFKPAFGRLDGHRGDGWCSQLAKSNREWLQVDLGEIFKICGVASQGDVSGEGEYVSAFKLSFSFDGSHWIELKNEDESDKIFQRNGDSETTDQHELSSPVLAQYVRVHPTARNKWNCMRLEVYGTEPIDGNWGIWSSWGACSATCDNGTRRRTRKCDSPAPKPGGKDCAGDDHEDKECEEMISCDVGPYGTSFEIEGMHGWELCASNTKSQWYVRSGQTGTENTGPNGDHTKEGAGRYIYFEASPGKSGDTACFHSPEIAPTSCQRLTFWYNMYGSSLGTLRVLIKSPGSTKTLWEMSCQQGLATEWLQASVDISSETQFQIYFEGTRGSWIRGDIAVDDVKLKECSDASSPPSRFQGSPDVCFSNPLGVSDPSIIPDSHMTASSEYKTCFKPAFARLDRHRGDGWCSQWAKSNREWLQVDLGDIFQICGVASQGDFSGDQEYVSAFKLSFSSNGNDWTYYKKDDGTDMIFQRNGDSETTDQHELSSRVLARYVRFHPTARNKWNCMRVEVYGTTE